MTLQSEVEGNSRYIKVLDQGFVGLIDTMGSDADIVNAARVSYGNGTKSVREDRGLIRYLVRHKHTSPLEMAEVKLHLKLPIFVMRQLVRHRTACLSGGTNLHFTLPAKANQQLLPVKGSYKMKISEFHNKWHQGSNSVRSKKHYYERYIEKFDLIQDYETYSIRSIAKLIKSSESFIQKGISDNSLVSTKNINGRREILGSDFKIWITNKSNEFFDMHQPMRDRLAKMNLRSVDEKTGEIYHTRVSDIWESGIKKIYKLTLNNGYEICSTLDHRYFTDSGWKTLRDAINLKLKPDGITVSSWVDCNFSTNGVPNYQSMDWLRKQVDANLRNTEIGKLSGVSEHTIRKWLSVHNIKRTPEQLSYLTKQTNIGRKFTKKRRGPLTGDALKNVQAARCGSSSNFWRGGVMNRDEAQRQDDRELYNAKKTALEKYGYKCAVTGESGNLQVHHIDPIWNNPNRKYDTSNLIPLKTELHRKLHSLNLELKFKESIDNNTNLSDFFKENQIKITMSDNRRKLNQKERKEKAKLIHKWSNIKNIEYVGEEMTYDLSVEGPYHNFIANGITVHNSLNEYSGRYSVLTDEMYVPNVENILPQSKTNKQGRAGELNENDAAHARSLIKMSVDRSYETYKALLNDYEGSEGFTDNFSEEFPEDGIARELARITMPVAGYTELYWKQNLHNLFHMLKLREDPHAQWEIQEFARAIYSLIKPIFPLACEAYEDYIRDAKSLSSMESELLQTIITRSNEYDLSFLEAFGHIQAQFETEAEFLDHFRLSKRELVDFKTTFSI